VDVAESARSAQRQLDLPLANELSLITSRSGVYSARDTCDGDAQLIHLRTGFGDTLMTKSITVGRLSALISLFAYLSIGPNASHFTDSALVRSLAAQAPSANYTYTVIADVSNCPAASNPVLNNNGEAAFVARCPPPIGPSDVGPVVRRGDGGPLTEIYTWTPDSTFSVPDLALSINDNGTVAFAGFSPFSPPPFRYAILAGDGGPISAIVDTDVHTQFKALNSPSINNSGAVAFAAVTGSAGYDAVVVANGGSLVTIAGPGSATASVGVLTHAFEPALNNNGVVSFFGQGLPTFGLFAGSAGPLTTISLKHPSTWSDINDLGRVAFVATDTATGAGSVEWGDGVLGRIVALADGQGPRFIHPYWSFSGSAVSVNNASLVAFGAKTASSSFGIYIGPNPATDAVIKAGDIIPGLGTVTAVSMSEEGLNDAGQVAFAVAADQGGTEVRAIVRADPIRKATLTALGISPSPGVFGEPMTLTANVAASSGVASGQVEFFEGTTPLGTTSLINGVGSVQTSALALGSHRLLAVFGGSSGFLPSISPDVPLIVIPPAPVQAPIALRASSISGNLVTLRWTTSPSGARPTSFVVEGGVTPGDVAASISTNSPFPIMTVAAPTGAFYVRVHAIAGGERSAASNEIRIFVNVPTPPSPPADLVALVNESSLALTWRPTFVGGAATTHVLNVTGSVNASLPLGGAISLTFNPVPGGTYTLSVSAANAAGTSAPSNAVTVTLPGACSGAPLTPAGFLAYRVGSTILVVWDPPASGPAPTQYQLNVTGTFVGSFSTTALTLSGSAGPGSYDLSLLAANACGSSPATPPQTITVPG
jgi:hypothetical protein